MEKSQPNSKDLLHSFIGSSSSEKNKVVKEEDVELNLGLSLGGRFGIDKSTDDSYKLKRSSSIASCLPVVRDDSSAYAGLVRTSSLPVETEEEWRKRKELQSLRRMEAKRRRSEKQRNSRSDKEMRDREKPLAKPLVRLNSLGSVESKGATSSSLQVQGSSGEPSPSSIRSLQEASNPDAVSSRATGSQSESARGQVREASMEDMPCVFTKGEGPNGRRVDGILYKYGKGEEVRIMCVCHGSFHSPAEFVEHAGWTNVDNPLKHIVINQNSSPLL